MHPTQGGVTRPYLSEYEVEWTCFTPPRGVSLDLIRVNMRLSGHVHGETHPVANLAVTARSHLPTQQRIHLLWINLIICMPPFKYFYTVNERRPPTQQHTYLFICMPSQCTTGTPGARTHPAARPSPPRAQKHDAHLPAPPPPPTHSSTVKTASSGRTCSRSSAAAAKNCGPPWWWCPLPPAAPPPPPL